MLTLSVQAWPEMRGQAQGWVSSGSLRLGHLGACRSCRGRREGDREELRPVDWTGSPVQADRP